MNRMSLAAIDRDAVARILRKMRLLRAADGVHFLFELYKTASENREFLKANPDFTPPPLWLAFDAYHHTNWRLYWETGVLHARFFGDLMLQHVSCQDPRICEWGCGPGRIIRHLVPMFSGPNAALHATDIDAKTIAWCRTQIPSVHFEVNGLAPPLPFDANVFDAVLARSVFTHLSEELHFAWIEELYRVIKPGGVVILTTHGDSSRSHLSKREKDLYDAGRFVAHSAVREGSKCFTAFHSPTFVRSCLLKQFTVLEHLTQGLPGYLQQDVWVAQKASTEAR